MSFKTNLRAALKDKKLADLKDIEKTQSVSNLVIPTTATITEVINALREGKKLRMIQVTVKQDKRILTIDQIKRINRARREKIAALKDKATEPEIGEVAKEAVKE